MLSPSTCRAARSLLNWKQSELAEKSGVSVAAIRTFELGKRRLMPQNLNALQRAFEQAGIEFLNTDSPGVRLCPQGG
jgi:transcriptional regulator with XRE-family HTH domain